MKKNLWCVLHAHVCKNAWCDVDMCAYYILIEAISSVSEYSAIDRGAVVGVVFSGW